ncbi:LacI family DNA-binding transcriptional regulator [Bifidobacterium catenulatum]|nr:LacI family DNA-binding transcriptional regulator [Bifidobacterium catenulatum]
MVTISDVAHAAGVSKATVSYVLSGDPRITQATTLKVQHAIDELGYTVNHAARALSVRKTKTIGVVSPPFTATICQLSLDCTCTCYPKKRQRKDTTPCSLARTTASRQCMKHGRQRKWMGSS